MTDTSPKLALRISSSQGAGLSLLACIVLAVVVLRLQGRRWWCACGQPDFWWTDTNSSHNSQHWFDPYAFTHVLHGILLCGLLVWAVPRMARLWQLVIGVAVELLWEIVENTSFVIQRYRDSTMALGYEGDSVANSVGDTLAFALGFALARRIGWRWSAAFFLATEIVLLFWIKDSLLLNVVMLLYPLDAIKTWQLGP